MYEVTAPMTWEDLAALLNEVLPEALDEDWARDYSFARTAGFRWDHHGWRTATLEAVGDGYSAGLTLAERLTGQRRNARMLNVRLLALAGLRQDGELRRWMIEHLRRMDADLRRDRCRLLHLHVDQLAEDGWLVRGTQDPHEALQAIVEDHDGELDVQMPWIPDLVAYDGEFEPNERLQSQRAANIGYAADWCHTMLQRHRVGTYRKVHCLPGSAGELEGWACEIHSSRPGRGAFSAVEFYP